MERTQITIVVDGIKEQAHLKYDSTRGLIKFSMFNGFRKKYEASDLYLCLAKIRQDHPDIIFLCKGAKLNVTPSRMCSQMSGGFVAYELTLGKPATREDMVKIFDYEENNLTNDIEEQKKHYQRWIESINPTRPLST